MLYRLWLKAEDLRPVDPEMADGYITGSQTGKPLARPRRNCVIASSQVM